MLWKKSIARNLSKIRTITLSSKFSLTITSRMISTLFFKHSLRPKNTLLLEFRVLFLVVFFLETVSMWDIVLIRFIGCPKFLKGSRIETLQHGTRTFIALDSRKGSRKRTMISSRSTWEVSWEQEEKNLSQGACYFFLDHVYLMELKCLKQWKECFLISWEIASMMWLKR